MKLNLNTGGTADFPAIIGINTPRTATDPKPGTVGSVRATRLDDRISFAVAPGALAVLVSDRASKLGQLATAVRSGSYSVSSALVSKSILASVTA